MSTNNAKSYVVDPMSDDEWRDQRLRLVSDDIFQTSGPNQVQILRTTANQSAPIQETLNDIGPTDIRILCQQSRDLYFFFEQYHSWHHISANREIFEELITILNPYTSFVDLLHCFGLRSNPDVRTVLGFRWHIGPSMDYDEVGYSVRYFARHGRTGEDPWSLRQTGVYENRIQSSGISKWVFIQAPDRLIKRLEAQVRNLVGTTQPTIIQSTQVHANILFTLTRSTSDHIDYLRMRLHQYEQRACYEGMGKAAAPHAASIFPSSSAEQQNTTKVVFVSVYKDLQRLHELQRKLLRAQQAIKSNVEVVRGCRTRCSKLASLNAHPGHVLDVTIHNLGMQLHEFLGHAETIHEMLEYIQSVSELLKTMLGTRHDETIRVQNELQQAAIGKMADLQAQGSADSKLLKSLTMLATVYLPVNLVVAFFSSNLVQVAEKGSKHTELRVWVLEDTWLLTAAALALAFLTILAMYFMERRNTLPPPKCNEKEISA